MKPVGMIRSVSLSTAKTITEIGVTSTGDAEWTLPSSVSLVTIQPMTQGIYFTDTGTSPDTSDLADPTKICGTYVAAGGVFNYDGDCRKLRFIEAAASASLNLGLYSNQGI